MSVASLCNLEATLQRPTITEGRSGGQGPTIFTTVPNSVDAPCSIQPASASTQMRYMQRQMVVTHTMYFDWDWKVFLGDRWVMQDFSTGGQRAFIVRGWYNSLELSDAWVADVEETRVPLT